MVQFSQTSWQEFSLPNVLETLRYAPMNLAISKTPLLHYTLPSELAPGARVNYHIQCGFKSIKWTGTISSFASWPKAAIHHRAYICSCMHWKLKHL